MNPEPPPQNALERLLQRASDPAVHGQMFRTLLEGDLFIYVPYHPEMVGEMTRSVDDGLTWVTTQDEEGPFTPVFTSEEAARHHRQRLPHGPGTPRITIAQLPARVLLGFLNNGTTTALLLSCGQAMLRLKPEAVAALMNGEFTERTAEKNDAPPAKTHVIALQPGQVPKKLREGVRVFCAQRRVPIAVYAVIAVGPDKQPIDNAIRLILWLRSTDNHFYNDFSLMAGRLVPPDQEIMTGVVTAEDEATLAFLQKQTPLWPVVPKA